MDILKLKLIFSIPWNKSSKRRGHESIIFAKSFNIK